jgi:hypothetical protein
MDGYTSPSQISLKLSKKGDLLFARLAPGRPQIDPGWAARTGTAARKRLIIGPEAADFALGKC